MQTLSESVPEQVSLTTRLTTSLLLLVLTAGMVLAGSWTWGELVLLKVQGTLAQWSDTDEIATLEEWEKVRSNLAIVMRLQPESAQHYQLMGLLYEWRFLVASNPVTTEAELVALRQQSIADYRQSAILRPAWPAGWANLARQKAMLGQEDEELLLALERAMTLGPNEADIRLMVTDMVTLIWPFLEQQPLRTTALEMIERSLAPPQNDNTLEHLIFIIERNMQSDLCPLLDYQELSEWAREACGEYQ